MLVLKMYWLVSVKYRLTLTKVKKISKPIFNQYLTNTTNLILTYQFHQIGGIISLVLVVLFVCLFVCSFVCLFVCSCVRLFVRLFIWSFVRFLIPPFVRCFLHLFLCLFFGELTVFLEIGSLVFLYFCMMLGD